VVSKNVSQTFIGMWAAKTETIRPSRIAEAVALEIPEAVSGISSENLGDS
jgi:hypothetical protein